MLEFFLKQLSPLGGWSCLKNDTTKTESYKVWTMFLISQIVYAKCRACFGAKYENYLHARVANISMVDDTTFTRLVCGQRLHDKATKLEDERHREVEPSPLHEDVHTAVSCVRLSECHVHNGGSGNWDMAVILHVQISTMRLEYPKQSYVITAGWLFSTYY